MKKLILLFAPVFLLFAFAQSSTSLSSYTTSIKASEFKKIRKAADFSIYYKENICPEGIRYNLVRVAPKADPVQVVCHSLVCSGTVLRIINQAAAGDIYYLDEVRTTCGEKEVKLEAGVFRILPD